MPGKKIRTDKTNYVVTSNFGGSKAEIQQLLVVLKRLIESREARKTGLGED